MPVTEQQARAIAFLAAAARPAHAPRWDEAGIYANVMKVADRSIASVTIAVMQAAEDRKAQSPGVIPTNGPHWRNPESAPSSDRVPFDPRKVCTACGKNQPTCKAIGDHEFVSVEAQRAAPKAKRPEHITVVKDGLCPHGVPPMNCTTHRPLMTKPEPAAEPEDDVAIAAARASIRRVTAANEEDA